MRSRIRQRRWCRSSRLPERALSLPGPADPLLARGRNGRGARRLRRSRCGVAASTALRRSVTGIVRVTQTIPVRGLPDVSFSDVGYRRLASDAHSLIAVAAYDTRDVNLTERGAPRRLTSIVNLARVRAVESHLRGDGIVVLEDGSRLKVASARREELERRLEEVHG